MAIHFPQGYTVVRQMHIAQDDIRSATEKLTSGSQINGLGDKPQIVEIADNIDIFMGSSEAVKRGIMDGISYAQTTEDGLAQISDVLGRGLELALQSSTGTMNDDNRNVLQIEFQEVMNTIEDIVNQTEIFGRKALSTAESEEMRIPVSTRMNTSDGRTPFESFVYIDPTPADLQALNLDTAQIGTVADAQATVDKIHAAIDDISLMRAQSGAAKQSELEARYELLDNERMVYMSAKEELVDTNMAEESAKLVVAQMQEQTAMAMHQQAMGIQDSFLKLLG